MKTKFILHGGMTSDEHPRNAAFFQELTKDLQDGDKVLFVGFARRELDRRQSSYERACELTLVSTDKNIAVENAELDTVVEQAQSAQAIYVGGGNTSGLQSDIESKSEFFDAIKGKVYAGSSAGAQIVTKYYFDAASKQVLEGFGWLPIRLMVHFGSEKYHATEETKKELEKYDASLKLVTIPEFEWKVFEINEQKKT